MPTGGGAPLRFADRAYGVDFSACAETGNQSDASISACRGDNDDLVPGARRFASCRGFDLACDLLQTIYRSSVWQYHGDACRRKNDHRERRCGCPDCGGDRHPLAGLHIRSRALARVAEAKAQSANEQVSRLRTTLDNQQLADAIAAEAHDTLAHSLSLLALNASALQAESRKLKAEAEQLGNANVAGMAGKIAGTTEDIRRQASGALDEAHSVIDMLRHPEDARLQLAANDAEASLTRDSLLQLIGDARAANMRIDTWIDVQQLGQLDESIGRDCVSRGTGGIDQCAQACAWRSGVVAGRCEPPARGACARQQSDDAAIPLAYGRHQEGGRSSWFGQTHTAGWRNMPIRF